jgi:23S rRNA pseudouridine1911/1915/1917 synthase
MTKPIILIVSDESAPDRLDHYLAAHAPELSRTRAKEIIVGGLVTLNGRPAKPSARLAPADVIEAEVPELEKLRALPESIPIDIAYEDDDIIVIDKASGMVMHPAPGSMSGTLVNALLGHGSALSSVGGDLRPGIVHRLDKDTSGLVVVAKNDLAHRKLSAAFEGRQVAKTYLALVWGALRENEGVIDAPIGRHRTDRKRMAVVPEGRPAVTRWKAREGFPYATFLEIEPETGRTHQIRVHMAHVHHPVIGDADYGGAGRTTDGVPPALRRHAKRLAALAARQALHARQLSFEHPRTGRRMRFVSPFPDDFAALLSFLRFPDGETGRVVGVDPGDARIGLAVSDEGRLIARSLDTLEGLTDEEAARRIAALVAESAVRTVVVGHPIRMDGTSGPRAARARELAAAIEDAAPARVVLWDERLSSAEAERIMSETGERTRGRKGRVDAIAAAVILQGYLDSTVRTRAKPEDAPWT